MKRILQVVGRMDRAGQETFLMNVLRALDPSEYEFTFSVNTNKIGEYEDEIKLLGGKIWHNPYSATPRNLFNYLNEFRQFLRREGPFDAIHCHVYLFGGFLLKVAHDEGVPIRIMHSHSTSDGMRGSLVRILYRKFALGLIKKHATEFVACGEDAYKGLFKEVNHSQFSILNNSILPQKYNLSISTRDKVRCELNIDTETKVIINVARFYPVKNHSMILRVFKQFHTMNPDSVLLLVGDGPLKHKMELLADELKLADKVHFMGVRSDIPELLNISDVFLMPSLYEGLPVSLIESQASGVPCVVSNSVTKEVDMGIGLVSFICLEEPESVWAEEIDRVSRIEVPDFENRIRHLREKGYTIESTWEKLRHLYG